MRRFSVNLARRRFVNVRPVVRVSTLLWVGTLALVAYDARLYWQSFSGHEDKTRRLAEVTRELRQEEVAIETGVASLRRMQLNEQNEEVAFLNQRIAERTFGWSVLFDRLAEVLPRRVRLLSLNPRRAEPERGHRSEKPESQVVLQIRGVAEGDEPLLELVDALFADPAFQEPQLRSESREDNGLLSFQLDVAYLPEVAAPSTVLAAEQAQASDSPVSAAGSASREEAAVAAGRAAEGSRQPTAPAGESQVAAAGSPPAAADPRTERRDSIGGSRERSSAGRRGAAAVPRSGAGEATSPEPGAAPDGGSRNWSTATLPAIPAPVRRADAPAAAPPASRGAARRATPPRSPPRRPAPLAPAASGARVPR